MFPFNFPELSNQNAKYEFSCYWKSPKITFRLFITLYSHASEQFEIHVALRMAFDLIFHH